ncbi:MAG TPA: hypothetical protein VKZ63_13545, partial [Kofleriaceae bacterium]|nr:hypothetical protein [Kofleriaceae bacterium]
MPLPAPARLLLDRLAAAPGPALAWLREVAEPLAGAGDPAAAAPAFVGAARRLGRAPIADGPALPGPDDPVPTAGWTAAEAGRAVILLSVAAGRPDELAALVQELYRLGDSGEKRAIVRALPLLPGGDRFVELALDAGR